MLRFLPIQRRNYIIRVLYKNYNIHFILQLNKTNQIKLIVQFDILYIITLFYIVN